MDLSVSEYRGVSFLSAYRRFKFWMINLRFYFLHIKWDLFILTSGCVLLQTKILYKNASLSIDTCQHNLVINVKLIFICSLLGIAVMYARCDFINTRNINEELCFVVIFYQIKSPETFNVYSQKSLSFITLISKKLMFTWWTFYFYFYQRNNSMQ